MIRANRIIGIDPGLRRTGWGIIECEGSKLAFIACGSVNSDERESLNEQSAVFDRGVAVVVERHMPHEAAVEETFVNADPRAALKLGQARGIALLVPAQAGLRVAEYAPNLIKKTVVGAGRAEKAQIRLMIRVLMPKADPDAADALAIAVCHAHHRSSVDILSRVVGGA